MNVSFLLGAGISIPAKMPDTKRLTRKILSGKGIVRRSDENYYFGGQTVSSKEYVYRVVPFVNIINREVARYYLARLKRDPNYEDLYYVSKQIYDSETGNLSNPVVQSFINKIQPYISNLLIGQRGEIRGQWKLWELANETNNYIKDIVWHMLAKIPGKTNYLYNILEACFDNDFNKVYFYTLNHDLVLEMEMRDRQIEYADGFDFSVQRVRRWHRENLLDSSYRIKLFKLHGSINWFRFTTDGEEPTDDFIGIPLTNDYWHARNEKDQMLWPVDGRSRFLIGTNNKLLDYNTSIFVDIHQAFLNSLRNTKYLVVSGYSFGDKAINIHLLRWLNSSEKNKMVIIHPRLKELRSVIPVTFAIDWNDLHRRQKLFFIAKGIEKVSWKEIRQRLGK